MPLFLGLDIGTSGAKALIADETGAEISLCALSYDISVPRPGWAEQDADMLWRAAAECVRGAIERSGRAAAEIAAVGMSGQMHGLTALDASLRPVRPIILWADQRSAAQAARLKAAGAEQIALNPAAAGFLLPSLMWMKEFEPEAYSRTARALLPKDYIRLRLTGEIGTEATDATGTLALDARTLSWSKALLSRMEIDPALFPAIGRPEEIAGRVSARAARETGLAAGTPVIHGGGDGPMQLTGNGVLKAGMLTANIGTASQIDLIADSPLADPQTRLQNFRHVPKGRWICMGASLNGGSVLKWLRNGLFDGGVSYRELDELAAATAPGSDGLLTLPYLSGERTPHMDPLARGAIFGLTLAHTRGHVARSAMEGVAFALRDCLSALAELHPDLPDSLIASGGGAASALWRQILADVLKKRVYVSETREAACLGAAMTAAAGVGCLSSIDEIASLARLRPEATEPDAAVFERYDECYERFKRLYQNNRALFRQMGEDVSR